MPRRFDVAGLRSRMGLSQAGLADRVGVTARTIRRWELAEVDPSPAATKLLRQVKDAHDGHGTTDSRSDDAPLADTPDDALTAATRLASRGPRRLAAVLPSLP